MELFVDTSALVKLYYPEEDSDRVETRMLEATRIYICELALVEFSSALTKKARVGEINEPILKLIWEGFAEDLDTSNIEIISLFNDDYLKAADLILKFGVDNNLRTLDSLPLAAALKKPQSRFMTADSVLMGMAEKIGLRVEKY